MSMSTDGIGCTGCGGDYFYSGGDIGDLAFAVAAYQLRSLDEDLRGGVKSIKIITALKKAYRERMEQLQAWIDSAEGDLAKIPLEGSKKTNYRYDPESGTVVEDPQGKYITPEDRAFIVVDSEGRDITAVIELIVGDEYDGLPSSVQEVLDENPGSEVYVVVEKEQLQAELTRLQGQMDDLTSDGEMQLLAINRLMGHRNQALQLASNIMSSSHQSAMGIIANIK